MSNKKKKTAPLKAEEVMKQVRSAMVPQKDYIATLTTVQAFEVCAGICGDYIICLNELADSYMVEVISALTKEKKWWRHDIKRMAKEAQSSLRKNIAHATTHIANQNRSFYYEYVDAYVDNMRKDVEMLYWTINQALTKAGYGRYCDLFARVEVLRVLLILTCNGYDDVMRDIKKRSNINFTSVFWQYRPTGATHYWRCLSDTLFAKIPDKNINLNDDQDIKTAYQVLLDRIVHGEFLDEAAKVSLEANINKLDDEKLKEYEEIKERLKK